MKGNRERKKDGTDTMNLALEGLIEKTAVASEPSNKIEESFQEAEKYTDRQLRISLKTFLKNLQEDLLKRNKQKEKLKKCFFVIVMGLFSCLVGTAILLPICSVWLGADFQKLILMTLTSLTEIIVAILVLPKIIAEYLFNKEEDEKTNQLLKEILLALREEKNVINKAGKD